MKSQNKFIIFLTFNLWKHSLKSLTPGQNQFRQIINKDMKKIRRTT